MKLVRTEYSWMTSKELVDLVMNAKDPLPLVVELAQRLDVYLNEPKEKSECQHQKAESKTR